MTDDELFMLWKNACPSGVKILDMSLSKRQFKISVCGVPDLYDEEGTPLVSVLSWNRKRHPTKELDTSLLDIIDRSYVQMRIKKGQLLVN